jgi:hypothetical protein
VSVARIYRVGTPYNGTELDEIDFEQSADTMYLAHIDHAPTKLVRVSHTDWTFSSLTFGPTIATPTGVTATATTPNTDSQNGNNSYFPQGARYVVTAVNDDTGQESRRSAEVSVTNDLGLKRNYNTVSWTAVASANRYRVYKAESTGEFGYIGTTSQSSFRDDNIGADLNDGPPDLENPFPGVNDYPSTVSFFQQRLLFARTNNKPNAVWGSRTGNYENFDTSRPLKATDGLSFALVAGRVNAVNQLVSMSDLLALTSDSVFAVSGGQDGYLSPTNIVTNRENGRGSSRLPPLVVDNVCFYQTSVGNSVRTLGYTFESDGYTSNDMTIFSPHFFRDEAIMSWAYTQEPRSTIWAAREDGALLCFTWEQDQQVWGWTLCETDGAVESLCSVSENGEDRLYLTVRRTINGQERLFIERMASTHWGDVSDTCFMDCAVTFAFTSPATVLTNLFHLEGKSVVALADGAVIEDLVVQGGEVTLPQAASKVTVGLPYTASITTLPLAFQGKGGWVIAKPQQASTVVLRLVESRGIYAGPAEDKLDEVRSRQREPFGTPPALITGTVSATLQPHISAGVEVVVSAPYPLPFTLTTVLIDPSVSE